MCAAVASPPRDARTQDTAAHKPPLSPRELQAARLAADGRTFREIGAVMGISWRTAKLHCDRSRLKLGGLPYKRRLRAELETRGLL